MGFKQINNAFIIMVFLAVFIIETISAREDVQIHELFSTGLSLDYTKVTTGDKVLKARLTSRIEGKWIGVNNAEVYFYALIDTTNTILGKSLTNENGEAVLRISANEMLINSNGDFAFKVRFEGNQTYTGAEKELTVRDIQMVISLSEIDSVKKVCTEVYEITGNGEKVPLEDVEVYFYVTRLFGLLKIGEGWLINGKSNIEFPDDLPGDNSGNLIVVARIEDNELYGNVEVREKVNWGIAVSHNPGKASRELWTRTAPLWMIIALVTLLSFTWIIYLTLFYNMYRIRKTGKIANNKIE